MASLPKGAQKHLDRLKALHADAKAITRALYLAGQEIELEAERSITEGSISGPGHVPSLPGEPPNADTRHLDTNIETVVVAQDPPTVHVVSHAHYSAALEFGTSRIAPRPFMSPAARKKKGKAVAIVKAAVKKNLTKR